MKVSAKLSALFLMILLTGICAIGYLGHRATARMLEKSMREQLETNAFHTMDKIDRMLLERHQDMVMLAEDPIISSRRSTPGQVTERMKTLQRGSGYYASLAFFNLKRVRLADTSGSNIGVKHPFAEYWPDIAAGKDFVITIAESLTLKKVVIYFAAVVKDGLGRPFGVVTARMPVENLYEIAEETSRFHKEGERLKVELWDRDGLLLYSSYEPQGMLKEKSPDWEYLKEPLSGKATTGSVRHGYRGDDEISAFSRERKYGDFEGHGWVLVICTPTDTAFAPARKLGRTLFLIFIVIGLALMPVVFMVSRGVLRPLKELSRAAKEIGKGNLGVTVEVGSRDEIGELAHAFNQMARDLKASERKYKDLAELLPQIVYEIDGNGDIVFANHYGLNMFGYAQDDLDNGLNAMQMFVPEDRDRLLATIQYGMRGEQIKDVEFIALRKDGSRFPMLTFASPIIHENKPVGLRGIGIDISDRKRADEELKSAKDEWERTFDSITAPIMLLDVHHKIIKANKSMANKMGVTPSEAIGLTCYDAVHGKNEPPEFCPHSKLLADSRTHSTEIYEERLGGHYVITVSPLFTPDGTLYGSVHYAADITERKRAEQEQQKFVSLIENSSDFIGIASLDGRVLHINAAGRKLVGIASDDEARTKMISDFFLEEDLHEVKDVVLPSDFWQGEFRLKHFKTGRAIPVDLTRFLIRDLKTGQLLAHATVTRDITERKLAEEKISRLNEELEAKVDERTKQLLDAQEELVRKEKLTILGQLSGSVGHELRNPLGVINNAVYYLKTVLKGADEKVGEYLGIIKSEVETSLRIISDLLDFSRTKTAQTQVVPVAALINTSLAACTIPDNVKVVIDLPETLPLVKADPLQMRQVFQNLIMNGVQTMPEGGSLRVAARRVGSRESGAGSLEQKREKRTSELRTSNSELCADFIEISVADTGDGIEPENMNKLFQPLFTTKARGIGLGLSVSKMNVEANGGRIEVESRLGKGTIFTVILPCERGQEIAG